MSKKLFYCLIISLILLFNQKSNAETDTLWCCANEILGAEISCMRFIPNSELIAYGCKNPANIYILKAATGEITYTFNYGYQGSEDEILNIEFNSNGSKMLFIHSDGTTKNLYEVDMNTREKIFINQAREGLCGYSNDNSILYYYKLEGIALLHSQTKSIIKIIPNVLYGQDLIVIPAVFASISISYDNSLVAAQYTKDNSSFSTFLYNINIYDIQSGEIVKEIKDASFPKFSKLGNELFYLYDDFPEGQFESCYLIRCDYENNFSEINRISCVMSCAASYSLSSNAQFIVLSDVDSTSVYDVNGNKYYTYPFKFGSDDLKDISSNLKFIAHNNSMLKANYGMSSVNDYKEQFKIRQLENLKKIEIYNSQPKNAINSLKIIDISGNLILEIKGDNLKNNVINLSTSGLVSGTYFLIINSNTGRETHKFIVI